MHSHATGLEPIVGLAALAILLGVAMLVKWILEKKWPGIFSNAMNRLTSGRN
ncbi:MAG: hypothetical protein ABIH91_02555 [Candidatus Omnitrophota bacterium]